LEEHWRSLSDARFQLEIVGRLQPWNGCAT